MGKVIDLEAYRAKKKKKKEDFSVYHTEVSNQDKMFFFVFTGPTLKPVDFTIREI